MFGRDNDPEPDVKLALGDQQWLLNVLLEDEDVGLDVGRVDDRRLLGGRGGVHGTLLGNQGRSSTGCIQAVGMGEVLKLLRFGPRRVVHDQSLKLIDGVEQVDTAASVGVGRLKEPHVVPVEEGVLHREGRILPLLLAQSMVFLDVPVDLGKRFLATVLVLGLQEGILALFEHVEVVAEFVELVLAERRPQVDHKRDRDRIKAVLVQVLAQL